MYQKYFTEALVLSHRERGEADRVFTLYTREFGLVHARASSVRSGASKMRYGLQTFSRVSAALVKGKRGWRIAGVSHLHGTQGSDPKGVRAFGRLSTLIERLVGGEEEHAYLFSVLSEAHASLLQTECPAAPSIELVCAARILYALGYLSPEATESALFTHAAYADEHLQQVEARRDTILASVNRAIAAAQL